MNMKRGKGAAFFLSLLIVAVCLLVPATLLYKGNPPYPFKPVAMMVSDLADRVAAYFGGGDGHAGLWVRDAFVWLAILFWFLLFRVFSIVTRGNFDHAYVKYCELWTKKTNVFDSGVLFASPSAGVGQKIREFFSRYWGWACFFFVIAYITLFGTIWNILFDRLLAAGAAITAHRMLWKCLGVFAGVGALLAALIICIIVYIFAYVIVGVVLDSKRSKRRRDRRSPMRVRKIQ